MNNRYIIVTQQYSPTQHPPRTLEVVGTSEGLFKAMEEYENSKGIMVWKVIRTERDVNEKPMLKEIKYGLGTEVNEFTKQN